MTEHETNQTDNWYLKQYDVTDNLTLATGFMDQYLSRTLQPTGHSLIERCQASAWGHIVLAHSSLRNIRRGSTTRFSGTLSAMASLERAMSVVPDGGTSPPMICDIAAILHRLLASDLARKPKYQEVRQ